MFTILIQYTYSSPIPRALWACWRHFLFLFVASQFFASFNHFRRIILTGRAIPSTTEYKEYAKRTILSLVCRGYESCMAGQNSQMLLVIKLQDCWKGGELYKSPEKILSKFRNYLVHFYNSVTNLNAHTNRTRFSSATQFFYFFKANKTKNGKTFARYVDQLV